MGYKMGKENKGAKSSKSGAGGVEPLHKPSKHPDCRDGVEVRSGLKQRCGQSRCDSPCLLPVQRRVNMGILNQ